MDADANLAAHARRFLSQYPPVHRLDLDVADCSIRVECNDASLNDSLRHYYRTFATEPRSEPAITVHLLETPPQTVDVPLQVYPPAPGKTRIKDEYSDLPGGRLLRKRRTGMLFLFGGKTNLGVGPCLENLNQVVNFINNRFIARKIDQGYALCHAAAVAHHDRGLALAGMAGRGKSSLALHLLDSGLDFVSNDRLLIRRTPAALEMLGVPKFPRVNPGTLLHNPGLRAMLPPHERSRLEQLPRSDLWNLEQKHDVDIPAVYGARRMRLLARMLGAVILNWHHDQTEMRAARVDLAERRDLLDALTKSPGVNYRRIQGAPTNTIPDSEYLARLSDCPVIEITGGVDFAGAVDACLDLLQA